MSWDDVVQKVYGGVKKDKTKVLGKRKSPISIPPAQVSKTTMTFGGDSMDVDFEDEPEPIETTTTTKTPPIGTGLSTSIPNTPIVKRGQTATVCVPEGCNSGKAVFCLCRKPEAGFMIDCEVCHEWCLAACVKVASGNVEAAGNWTCPKCVRMAMEVETGSEPVETTPKSGMAPSKTLSFAGDSVIPTIEKESSVEIKQEDDDFE